MGNTDAKTEKSEKETTDKIIKNHMYGAIAVGLVPIPAVDMVALTGVQLNMLRKIAKSYDIPFSRDKGKNLIAALAGSGIPVMSAGPLMSLAKTIPVVGQTVGALSMSAVAGATTYAVGKVFVQHFASGGTFLDFDPAKVREYYAEKFNESQDMDA